MSTTKMSCLSIRPRPEANDLPAIIFARQALVIALMIVVTDERINLRFEVSWQEVVFQQDAFLQGLLPPRVNVKQTHQDGH